MLAGIVLLNVTMVVGALVARRRLPTYGDQDSDTFALVAAMDGVDFASRADALAAGSGTAVAGGIEIDLSVGPVGFDIDVIALWLQVNPGTLLGIIPAVILFRRL